jgi:hypothetical protein
MRLYVDVACGFCFPLHLQRIEAGLSPDDCPCGCHDPQEDRCPSCGSDDWDYRGCRSCGLGR